MAAIKPAMVKELRERTGLGMMDCKKALTEAGGDLELAIVELRKKSSLKAAKKAGRTAAEGLLGMKVSDDGSRGVAVEINIETDFAARNDKFIAFVQEVVDAAFTTQAPDAQSLMSGALDEKRQTLVQEIGENINVRRVAHISADDGGRVGAYLHSNNRLGALAALTGGDEDLARDIAMHITGSNPAPVVVSPDDMDEATVAKEREIFEAQAADSGKPPEIISKMVEGRIRKYLAEVSLTEQPFVKDPDTKIGKLLKSASAQCAGFIRLEVGEGIEKEEEDFAAEVAKQVAASE